MSKKNTGPVDDRTMSISGSSVDLQSLRGKESSEKTNTQDSNTTESEVSGSINLDQTIGMAAALQKTFQEVQQEKQDSPNFSPAGYSNLVEIGKGGKGKIYKEQLLPAI